MNQLAEDASSTSSNHHGPQFAYSDNDISIILIGSTNQHSHYARHRSTWSQSANLDVVDLTESEYNDSSSISTPTQIDEDSKIRSMLATNYAVEPFLQKLDCPVCMESYLSILRNGNKLMSTICGHVFCQSCLFTAIKANQKCPSCREILHLNSKSKQYIHRLYLPVVECKKSSSV